MAATATHADESPGCPWRHSRMTGSAATSTDSPRSPGHSTDTPRRMEDVVTALNKKVSQIVGDAGWRGAAASAFTADWEKVSAEANALGLVIIQTGSIVDQLAAELSKIENALEQVADQAAAHGVQVGGNGQPPQVCYTGRTQEDWRLGYDSFYRQCIAAARRRPRSGRRRAAEGLRRYGPGQGQAGLIVGPGNGGRSARARRWPTTWLTCWPRPPSTRTRSRARWPSSGRRPTSARQAWLEAQAAARQANGQFGVMPSEVKQALKDAKTELASENTISPRRRKARTRSPRSSAPGCPTCRA